MNEDRLKAIEELEQKIAIKDNECHGLINRKDVLEERAKYRNVDLNTNRLQIQKAITERGELFSAKHILENQPRHITSTKNAIFISPPGNHTGPSASSDSNSSDNNSSIDTSSQINSGIDNSSISDNNSQMNEFYVLKEGGKFHRITAIVDFWFKILSDDDDQHVEIVDNKGKRRVVRLYDIHQI